MNDVLCPCLLIGCSRPFHTTNVDYTVSYCAVWAKCDKQFGRYCFISGSIVINSVDDTVHVQGYLWQTVWIILFHVHGQLSQCGRYCSCTGPFVTNSVDNTVPCTRPTVTVRPILFMYGAICDKQCGRYHSRLYWGIVRGQLWQTVLAILFRIVPRDCAGPPVINGLDDTISDCTEVDSDKQCGRYYFRFGVVRGQMWQTALEVLFQIWFSTGSNVTNSVGSTEE